MYNPCFNDFYSCSTCCGFHNIGLSSSAKIRWVQKNTKKFLSLNPENRTEILDFRRSGEEFLQPTAIRKDVYICPFIGAISDNPFKTGCLLHKEGSPHGQIKKSDSPQSFSFYGSGICKTYSCLARQSVSPDFATILKCLISTNPLAYGKIVSNHNLLEICSKIAGDDMIFYEKLLRRVSEIFSTKDIPVTSFEMPLNLSAYSTSDLWNVLGTLFEQKGYLFEAFQITEKGKETGKLLEKSII